MEQNTAKLKDILEGLCALTRETQARWSEGDRDGSYYIRFEGYGVVIYKEDQLCDVCNYRISFMNPTGRFVFTQVLDSASELYDIAKQLYDLIVNNDTESNIAFDALLKAIRDRKHKKDS